MPPLNFFIVSLQSQFIFFIVIFLNNEVSPGAVWQKYMF